MPRFRSKGTTRLLGSMGALTNMHLRVDHPVEPLSLLLVLHRTPLDIQSALRCHWTTFEQALHKRLQGEILPASSTTGTEAPSRRAQCPGGALERNEVNCAYELDKSALKQKGKYSPSQSLLVGCSP
mmetsp:Transcript_65089/g.127794  ORF Transcript_65089/g.127794 Transcript_65089/m.127794 type:complete len:127 (+) Transcript_65089:283-663(+)